MRILYFTRDYTPHDHRFLAGLAESDNEVYYLRLERRGHQQEERMLPLGVKQVNWAGGRKPVRIMEGPQLLASLRDVLQQIRPDVLHAGPIQTVGLLAAMSGFRPLVTISWGSDLLNDAEKNRLYRWATFFTLKRSDVLLGDCDAVKQKAVAYGFPEGSVVTFPWGVDLRNFSPGEDNGLRARAGWEDAFVILHLRSWEQVYGVDVFANAFVFAARQCPELRLFMLGNGSLATEIHRILMQSNLIDRVHFSGQVKQSDLPEYYRASDLYVSASHSDGSSVSLMEALACGVPVLVSDIPGNREWVVHGEHGWLFTDGDIQSLAQGILHAVEHREALPKIGQNARKLAEERANWSQNFEKLLEAYEMAVARYG